jgi:hypothetical protein
MDLAKRSKCGISGLLLVLYVIAYCILVHGNLYQDSHPLRVLVYAVFAIWVFCEYLRSPSNCGLIYYLGGGLVFYATILGLLNFHRPFFSWYSLLSDLITLSGFFIGIMLCVIKGNLVIMKTLTACFYLLFLLASLGTLLDLHATSRYQRLDNMSVITAIDYCIRLFPIALCYKRLSRANLIPLLVIWLLIVPIIITFTCSRGSLLIYVTCTLLAALSFNPEKITISTVITYILAILIFLTFYLINLDLFTNLINRIVDTELQKETRFYEITNVVKDAGIELIQGRGLGARNYNHLNFEFVESFCTVPHAAVLGFMYKFGILGFLFFWLFPTVGAVRLIFSGHKTATAFALSLIVFKLGDCIGGTWDSIGMLFFSIALYLSLGSKNRPWIKPIDT